MNKNGKKGPMTQADKIKEKARAANEQRLLKREMEIDNMSPDAVLNELKNKGIPTFGTAAERKDRLKKHNGITPTTGGGAEGMGRIEDLSSAPEPPKMVKRSGVVDKIEEMKIKREERRKKMEEGKRVKLEREAENLAIGKVGDVDFELMIDRYRAGISKMKPHWAPDSLKINVCVRKRPIFKKELQAGELDSVSVTNPNVIVHDCKYRVDGITKYLDNNEFMFDNTFSEKESSEDLYKYSIKSLIPLLFSKGVVTCFAYGQTGSGKTFTMKGSQEVAIRDLFSIAERSGKSYSFTVSFFEIYGGKLFDLLNNRNKLVLLEDKNQKIQVQGLVEKPVTRSDEMLKLLEYGHTVRTTHCTSSNDTSSRSHAICQIIVRDSNGYTVGKFSLVDLAGSERAQDCQSNNRQRRLEGAEINKSLLALKECIRALDAKGTHVPFRASKLTMVLRDSFIASGKKIRIVMIACVSPGKSSADHTINTLRYAFRLKENPSMDYDEALRLQEEREDIIEAEPVAALPAAKPKDVKPPISHPPPPKKEIKKRIGPAKDGLKKKDSSSEIESEDHDLDGEHVEDDWKYLKQTLHGRDGKAFNQELFNFAEKADTIMEEEEELFKSHMQYLKEDAQLLTEEGKLINNLTNVGTEDHDIDDYIFKMEGLVKKKLDLYQNLYGKIQNFKKAFERRRRNSLKGPTNKPVLLLIPSFIHNILFLSLIHI
eukprot:TRINITY_DN458_c0_g1_i2.p1 TRINITY_DN458_c0_g1~~TRINITY_DN458_c0_g1_i2.p1  ORF type:complete len:712 (+),score=132.05 TRINITY_DN458_c0_g1_i2:218-2353(+)